MATASDWTGSSGRLYQFKQLLQERENVGRVWLATSQDNRYVLKHMPESIFFNFNDLIKPHLKENPYIRLPCDRIPNQQILVYDYLTDDLLSLMRQESVSLKARRKILRATLRGIAELHSQDVVHLDVKPDNVMVNYHQEGQDVEIERVQIIDLENAAYLPKGRCIKGMLPGNDNWRSPEGHLRGELNKPADIYSFGAVCIYTMLGHIIFGPDADLEKHKAAGALPEMIRLQRQISYFPDRESFNGLITHMGDDEISCQILGMLWDDRAADYHSYRPFSTWREVEDLSFRELVVQMMQLDPAKRISAQQALDHPWFRELEIE
ncbi:putative calcium/calmodulin dependent protein kinase [Amniculicola lignicola CBS 123094]|uniref:Putative calcium/calmodulin dependent protein kinase n=1 Tax=Amniculicola lignicola CBS 123094 TaxID=1392246 RepID=A0A6A5WJ19_9PLEO|nr:putative calcium/calmodulin dependent protein kinase [Amniculicola lignicola CBS 123094]